MLKFKQKFTGQTYGGNQDEKVYRVVSLIVLPRRVFYTGSEKCLKMSGVLLLSERSRGYGDGGNDDNENAICKEMLSPWMTKTI